MLLSLLFKQPEIFVIWVLAVIYAITVHEFSHALAGHLQGDKTAENAGRLTLNPFSHLDFIGLVLLIVIGFGWGKPVPFNPYSLKNPRFGPAIISLAGPFANLLSVVVFGVILRLILVYSSIGSDNLLFQFIINLIQINLILMIFNLIPVPPLDGSKLLYSLLPYSMNHIIVFLERYGPFILLGIIIFASPILTQVFDFFYNLVVQVVLLRL